MKDAHEKIIMILWMLLGGIGMEDTNISPAENPPGWNGTGTVSIVDETIL